MAYETMLQKAMDLHNQGALNQAYDIYRQLLVVMPENSDVWNMMGLIAQTRGQLRQAIDCFFKAVKYAPKPFFAHYFNLALCYKSLNQNKEAIKMMRQAVKLKADFKEGFNELGVLEALEGELNLALKDFCRALDIEPNYVDARVNLLFYSNDLDGLFKLAKEEKENFYGQYMAANACDDMAKKELYLQQAINIAPERVEALLMYALLLDKENRVNESLTYYNKVLNLDDNNLEAILGAADIYLKQKKYAEAEKMYLKSFEINKEVVGAHINYGTLLYEQNRFAEALEEYRKAVILKPELAETSYNLALILKETGDLEEALGLMFNAHLKDKNNELYAINIMETLSVVFEKNAELALKIAINWQKLEPDNIFSKRILAALSGDNIDEKDEATYAEKLFDNFALYYEKTLEKLEPEIINKVLEMYAPLKGKILDLGCGTGLAAEKLKNDKNSFWGVDVSDKMLKIADKKGCYQKLIKDDIRHFIKSTPALDFDYILAMDVFCYIGNLKEILAEIKKGEIIFSVESAEDNRNTDYYMAPNGRYKHKKSYVMRILKELKYENIEDCELILRKENGQEVRGVLFKAKAK